MEILDQHEYIELPSKWWRALGILRMPIVGIIAISTLATFFELYVIGVTSQIAENQSSFNFGHMMGHLIFMVLIFFFGRYHILQDIQEIKT